MQRIKDFYNNLHPLAKNKYAVAAIFFLVWMLFFDTNTFISQVKMDMQLQEMRAKKTYYTEEIIEVNRSLEELLTDEDSQEKFAREKYLMKKNDEDIFVISKE